MADGDPWSLDRVACQYQSDTGAIYRFRALEAYQAQAACGWTVSTDPMETSLPRGFKPRRWLLYNASDHSQRRSVVIGTNAAYIAGTVGTTTLSVQNPVTDVEDTFTLYAREGERHRGVERD